MGDNAYKQRHREQGLCTNCQNYALPYLKLCKKHNDLMHKRNRTRHRMKREEIRAKGFKLCIICFGSLDDEADKDRKTCTHCRELTGRRNRI